MARNREGAPSPATPEALLRKASLAKTAALRAKYARRGLAQSQDVDPATHALLLRQLYLSSMESERFEEARRIAERMVEMEYLVDVSHQDVARACLGLQELDGAIAHLRLAARLGPPSRRAFHLWTLGSVLLVNGMAREAVGPLGLAARWGTREKPLFRAQLALARLESGQPGVVLEGLREKLEAAPCGQGYGEYVLGELCLRLGDRQSAIRYLESFVNRVTSGRVALAVSLRGEISRAWDELTRLRSET